MKTGISSFDSWVIGYHRPQKLPQRTIAKALKDEMDGGTRGLPSPSWDPGLEVEVPFEQRPVCTTPDTSSYELGCLLMF